MWEDVTLVDQNGNVTEYGVMYEPLMRFGDQLKTTIVNTTNLSITLNDLEEFVNYNISVRAYTSVGPGPYSAGIVNITLEDGRSS